MPISENPLTRSSLIVAVCAGGSFGLASRFPELPLSAVLGTLFVVLLALLTHADKKISRAFFVAGFTFHLVAFPWLIQTLSFFGGFPKPVSFALFLLFCFVSSLQFLLVGAVYQRLSVLLGGPSLALGLAWFAGEMLVPRLFPWNLAHAFVPLQSFIGLAEFFGLAPLGFFAVWLIAGLSDAVLSKLKNAPPGHAGLGHVRLGRVGLVPLLLLFPLMLLGERQNDRVREQLETAPKIKIGLIQGNLEAREKRNVHLLEANLDVYRRLSQSAVAEGAQILFWPETVMNTFTPQIISSVEGTKFDPFPQRPVPLVYGVLSYDERSEAEMQQLLASAIGEWVRKMPDEYRFLAYNSGFAIDAAGKVLGRYSKRVLMPFGEFLPFASRYPWLRELSPQTGNFAAGDLIEPIGINLPSGEALRMSLLICYEDLLPSLSNEAATRGAEILVNLTNDAWYGETIAPYQHHLLALTRAIETRKFLVRVTNTGLTAVVSPLGESIGVLPIFEPQYSVTTVSPLNASTLYSRVGDQPCQVIALFCVVLAVLGRRRAREA